MHMLKRVKKTKSLQEFVNDIQAKGRLTFKKNEAISALKVSSVALNRAAERLINKKRLLHPVRGLYVIIPLEKRASGAPDPIWFIDDLMGFREQDYYIGVLSAAALHGASHQAPQELQVVTNSQLRPIEVGKVRIRFLTKKRLEETPTLTVKTPYKFVPVSSPEATAVDLVKYMRWAGHLGNVATVLSELKEKIDPKKLVIAVKACGELAIAQRLGYLLDYMNSTPLTKHLHSWVLSQEPCLAVLNPDVKTSKSKSNSKWKIILNDQVEGDL